MTTLTRTLLIAALSAPLSVAAQTTPTSSTKTGTPTAPTKSGAPTGGTAKTDTAKKEKLTEGDLQIIAHYHGDNVTEMDLGKLAAKRGTTQAVKAHGEMLVKDHGDFDKKLSALVKKTGQVIPAEKPDTAAKKEELANVKKRAATVQKATGATFDREYLTFMVDGHRHALDNIDADISATKNEELATMLRDVKPILQTHHDHARDAQQKDAHAAK